jgi:hypothetical protein
MGKRIWPEKPDAEYQQFLTKLYGSLCQHFVCLGIRLESIDETGNTTGDHHILSISCLVITVTDRCFLVTAGHILKELDERLASGRCRLVHGFIVYHLGHHETDGRLMPFDYRAAKTHVVHDQNPGLDYGIILLTYYEMLDLRKNNIIPVSMDYWRPRTIAEFDSFRLLGLPTEVASRLSDPSISSNTMTRNISTVYVSVEPITDESQIPYMILIRQLGQPTVPVFIGRITADIDFGINGMSGGPIFGLIEGSDGKLYYSVVAIQSEYDQILKPS